MALPSTPRLILFVAGEPKTVPSLRESGAGLAPRVAGMFTGNALIAAGAPTQPWASTRPPHGSAESGTAGGPEWYLPPDQMTSLNLVLDIAEHRGHEVIVIDANRPGNQQALVDQYVRPNDVFPILIRWDGARLEGDENFVPAKVRRFVEGR